MYAESRPSADSVETSRRSDSRSRSVFDVVCQGVGEVAADVSLDADRHDGPRHGDAVHAIGYVLEGVGDVGADPRLCQGTRELLRCRLGRVAGHRIERLGKAEAATQAGRDEQENVRAGLSRTSWLCAWPGPAGSARQEEATHSAQGSRDKERQTRGVAVSTKAMATPTTAATACSRNHSPARKRKVGSLDERHRPLGGPAALHHLVSEGDELLGDGRRPGWRSAREPAAAGHVALDRGHPQLPTGLEGGNHHGCRDGEERQRHESGGDPDQPRLQLFSREWAGWRRRRSGGGRGLRRGRSRGSGNA